MKTLNYIICSMALAIGITLLLTNNFPMIIAGGLWFVLLYKTSKTKQAKRMWRTFYKTNLEIEKYFGF